jgi:hypothetical protein
MIILDNFTVEIASLSSDDDALTAETVAIAAALDEFIARLAAAGVLVSVTDEVATVVC